MRALPTVPGSSGEGAVMNEENIDLQYALDFHSSVFHWEIGRKKYFRAVPNGTIRVHGFGAGADVKISTVVDGRPVNVVISHFAALALAKGLQDAAEGVLF